MNNVTVKLLENWLKTFQTNVYANSKTNRFENISHFRKLKKSYTLCWLIIIECVRSFIGTYFYLVLLKIYEIKKFGFRILFPPLKTAKFNLILISNSFPIYI